MFSVTTTASSITSPMAIAIAPRVIRLNVCPRSDITKIVMTRVSGMDDALTAVIRPRRRNRSSKTMASAAPISIASRTALTASRTRDAWSYTGLSRTPAGQAPRSGHVRDPPDVAPGHVPPPDARHARQHWLDLIARDVVQGRRIAALHIVGQNREERGRHSLDLDVHPGGEVGHDLVDARPHFLQGVDHLGRGREVHADLGAAPDGPGPDAGDAWDDAGRFFDGPGDTEELLPRPERRAGRDDRDAGKVELGVNGRGEDRRGPQARNAQERHHQVHEAPLATEDVEQRHRVGGGAGAGLRTMRAPSATPYAPLVTTISPAWSPDRISTVDSLRPPTVTDRTWATDPESTTNT